MMQKAQKASGKKPKRPASANRKNSKVKNKNKAAKGVFMQNFFPALEDQNMASHQDSPEQQQL